jgi:hypothetical protein
METLLLFALAAGGGLKDAETTGLLGYGGPNTLSKIGPR